MPTIMTVDDSNSMRQMVRIALQQGGYDVVEASGGEEALRLAEKGRVDAVISDVNMPGMDGITLIKKLRLLPDFRFTPILMLTTEAGADIKSQGKEAGASGWIVKPFSPDTLIKIVKQMVRR